MNGITIEGFEDCIDCIDKSPENLTKMTKVAMKKASSVVVKHIKGGFPSEWKHLVKSKIVTTTSGDITALVGAFNTQKSISLGNRHSWDWFKAYWKNYGTLQGRDPNHRFDFPIKRKMKSGNTKRRTSEKGIRYQNFFENATEGTESLFLDAFQKSLEDQKDKIYDR